MMIITLNNTKASLKYDIYVNCPWYLHYVKSLRILRTSSRLRAGYPTLLQWRGRYECLSWVIKQLFQTYLCDSQNYHHFGLGQQFIGSSTAPRDGSFDCYTGRYEIIVYYYINRQYFRQCFQPIAYFVIFYDLGFSPIEYMLLNLELCHWKCIDYCQAVMPMKYK